eukprot:gnl/MRDRNA2_/MRDRNA2_111018_c0_seq1.p1 gnl/MRDRNA2_/MRDRNA2_111018_c0~~gnl/MRDRNA2_/MRDRNA2_111018_c0_seq1.p1  ORF type:complete len:1262 (+),score=348.82 gnl/MRDRNA2_/MRDRNA2_111018_c0_seq1:119-3904(+)
MGLFDGAKTTARKAIDAATKKRDIAALTKAVEKGRQAKLPNEEVAAAETTIAKFQAEDKARADLSAALANNNLQQLRNAVQSGRAANLGEADMANPVKILAEEEAKHSAREKIANALADIGSAPLNSAIEEAEIAGILEEELKDAVAVAKTRKEAEDKIDEAIKAAEIQQLEAVVQQGEKDKASNAEAGKTALANAKECKAAGEDLAAAIAHPLDLERITMLRVAVSRAKAATGFDAAKVTEGEACLSEEEKREVARKTFQDGHKVLDVQRVQESIDLGKASGIPEEELKQMESTLAVDKEHTESQQDLSKRGVPELKAGIVRARAAGIDEAEVTAAETQLAARESAVAALAEALHTRGIEPLKAALETATSAGGSDEELADAIAALKAREEASDLIAQGLKTRDLEVLTKAWDAAGGRGKRGSAVAFVLLEEEQACCQAYTEEKAKAEALDAMNAALTARDHEALGIAITSAEAAGVSDSELSSHREEHKKVKMIVEAVKECESSEDVGKIRGTLLQAQALRVPDSMTLSCRLHLGRQESLSGAETLIISAIKQADAASEDGRGLAIEQLQQALSQGALVKLVESPSRAARMDEGNAMLQTIQKRIAACDAMATAVKEREGANNVDPFQLRSAMADAVQSGVTAYECKACEAALLTEEQRYAAVESIQRALEHRTEDVLKQFGADGANSNECIKELNAELEYALKVSVPEAMLTGPGSLKEAVAEEEEKCKARAKLHDNNPETRKEQLKRLHVFISKGHMDAATAVCGRLQDGDTGTRKCAAEILGQSPGDVAAEVASALSVQAADDPDEPTRCAMIASLAAIGSRGCGKATTALALQLQNRCDAARSDAARGLGPLVTTGNNQLAQLLCARLEVDPVADVRREAVSALRFAAATGDADIANALVVALDDGADDVHQEAIKVLKNLADPGRRAGVRALISRLGQGSYSARRLRIEALSAIAPKGDHSTIEAVKRLLQDRDASVRKSAGRALGVVAGSSSVELLSKQLEDVNWSVRWAAVESLAEVVSALSSEDFLQQVEGSILSAAFRLSSKDPSIRLVAAEALGRVFEVGLLTAITKVLPDPACDPDNPPMSPMMRVPRPPLSQSLDAQEGTGGTGDTPAPAQDGRIPIVFQWGAALEDDAPLRQQTLDMLMSLAGVKASAVDDVVDKRTITAVALRLEHGDLRVHHAAAEALAKNEIQGSAADSLYAQIRKGVWSIRQAICDVVKHVVEFREDAVLKAEEAVPQVTKKLIAQLAEVGL